MKNNLILALFIMTFFSVQLEAQYCNLPGRTPYSTIQPGIKEFKLNTIDRTSAPVESSTTVVVSTGLSTTLARGTTYTVTMKHTRDSAIFPEARNNIRVWIDYNQDSKFDESTETAYTKNLVVYGTTTFDITIPSTAKLGSTRLRATAKMSADGGHAIPTPCDSPEDAIGYHGEMEDYTVTITAGSGIGEVASLLNFNITPNPSLNGSQISYDLDKKSMVTIEVFDVLGNRLNSMVKNEIQTIGNYKFELPKQVTSGTYLVKITTENGVGFQRFTQL